VFVLGVYASAVHAEWRSPEGSVICQALAIASEPCIFWQEIIESQADTIILLGDEPIKWFLRFNSDCKVQKLSDFDTCGSRIKTAISGKEYDVIPLAHPRQIAALGTSSQKWYSLHQQWIQDIIKNGENR
jgi:hypothetical protein